MGSDWRAIQPKENSELNKFDETRFGATDLNLQLYPYDAFQEGTSQGFSSKEDFVSTIISQATSPVFNISLRPSEIVETADFSVPARWIKNITNYNQRDNDVTSLIYSQERPTYVINTELDLRDKLIFFTQDSIYGDTEEQELAQISKETPVFLIDSYNPIYSKTGVFQEATLTLKRIVSYKATVSSDGTVNTPIEFNFFRGDIQPQNALRRRRTWRSKPIMFFTEITDESDVAVDYTYTPNTQGKPFITPLLPRKIGGTKLNFVPSWINEAGYWNVNYSDKYRTQTKGPYAVLRRIITSTSDGLFAPEVQDTSRSKGLIPNYAYTYTTFAAVLGVALNREDLFKSMSEVLDFSSPFNFMGYIREDDINNFGSTTLSRKEDTTIAVWNTWKTQAYWNADIISNGIGLVIENIFNFSMSNIRYNPDRDVDAYNNTAYDILKGNAILFGQTINLRPPASYDGDFNFNPNPKDWDVEEMKKYTGVFWFNEDLQSDGSSSELQLNPILPDDLPSETGTRFDLGLPILNQYFESLYGSSQIVKQRLAGRDWYIDQNENWVEEIEWDTPIVSVTSNKEIYFGGYSYTDEWFENSYEDSLINGDVYCKFDFGGTEFNLPPLTYRALNRRGNPLGYTETRIWGTGGTREAKQTLLTEAFKQQQDIKKGIIPKKLININGGKDIKIKN